MPVPFLLLGLGALLGGGAAVHGVSEMSEASGITSRAQRRLDNARQRFDVKVGQTERAVGAYLDEADRVVTASVLPLVECAPPRPHRQARGRAARPATAVPGLG
jgi:hypothetical protein